MYIPIDDFVSEVYGSNLDDDDFVSDDFVSEVYGSNLDDDDLVEEVYSRDLDDLVEEVYHRNLVDSFVEDFFCSITFTSDDSLRDLNAALEAADNLANVGYLFCQDTLQGILADLGMIRSKKAAVEKAEETQRNLNTSLSVALSALAGNQPAIDAVIAGFRKVHDESSVQAAVAAWKRGNAQHQNGLSVSHLDQKNGRRAESKPKESANGSINGSIDYSGLMEWFKRNGINDKIKVSSMYSGSSRVQRILKELGDGQLPNSADSEYLKERVRKYLIS